MSASAPAAVRARVAVFFLGGTIAMVPGRDGAIAPALSGNDLIASVPGLDRVADLDVRSFMIVPSPCLTLDDLFELVAAIDQCDADGVVVVQGTDTIEETAFVLEMLVRRDIAVTVTGAMRGAREIGSDGAANIRAATVVASSVEARRAGVVVVMNDEIHGAFLVQKMHTSLVSAFGSPNAGRRGYVAEGRAHFVAYPAYRPPQLRGRTQVPVALMKIGMGEDGRLLPTLALQGFQGAVIEAMGVGHVPRDLAPLIEALCLEMPVILCSRVAAGAVFENTYGFSGSESDLLARGAIGSGSLGALKSRLLLQLLLGAGMDREGIRAYVEQVRLAT